jgi:transcriptional repressor NrdR
MECPYCHSSQTEVINSRPTRKNAQIWRRRKCLSCGEIFTTHEMVDLSHLVVIKKSGKAEVFSSIKLYSGIYGATIGSKTPNREIVVEKITREVEREIMFLKKKRITSDEIADIVLRKLQKAQTATFMRFLAYTKDISNEAQMKRELKKYVGKVE